MLAVKLKKKSLLLVVKRAFRTVFCGRMYASQEKKNLKVKGKQMDKRVESVERAMAPAFQDFPSKPMPQHACISGP